MPFYAPLCKMKKQLLLFLLILTPIFILAQKNNDMLLCGKMWWQIPSSENQKDRYTFTHNTPKEDVWGKTSYLFNNNGTYSWDTHPDCGNFIEQVRGNGKWKFHQGNKFLELTYSYTDYMNKTSTIIQKYEVIELSENILKIKRVE